MLDRISFRVDYFCTPSFMTTLVERCSEEFETTEIEVRRLSSRELKEIDAETILKNLHFSLFEYGSFNAEDCYIFHNKNRESNHSMTIIVNKYFCFLDLDLHTKAKEQLSEEEIKNYFQTLQGIILDLQKTNKVSFLKWTHSKEWLTELKRDELKTVKWLTTDNISDFKSADYETVKIIDKRMITHKNTLRQKLYNIDDIFEHRYILTLASETDTWG